MESDSLRIAVIIPVFNEEVTIRNTLLDFRKHLPDAFYYVVDNNSTDNTVSITRKLYEEEKLNGEMLHESKQGKANAIRKAFLSVDADIYLMIDGDNTYKAKDVFNIIVPVINDEADMTVGDRHKTGAYREETKRLFHNFGNTLVRKLINILFGSHLNDILSGYRCFNRNFVTNFPVMSSGFELETEMTLHALDKRFRIVEVPVDYKERPSGSFSKINTIRDGIKIIATVYQIFRYYKPLVFFTVLSAFFFAGAMAAGIPVLMEYARTRYVEHVPLSILATGLMILSVLSITIGFILDTIVRIHKFDYELNIIKASRQL